MFGGNDRRRFEHSECIAKSRDANSSGVSMLVVTMTHAWQLRIRTAWSILLTSERFRGVDCRNIRQCSEWEASDA